MITLNTDTRPNQFTGLWKGTYYYKGQVWAGPTNAIGCRRGLPRARFDQRARKAEKDVKLSGRMPPCVAEGPFTMFDLGSNHFAIRAGA